MTFLEKKFNMKLPSLLVLADLKFTQTGMIATSYS